MASAEETEHHARKAYQAWARYYDTDHANVRFDRIGQVFHELASRYGGAGTRLLDLGCGTGTSALVFASLGYQVTGCDIAPAMLEIARRKPGAERVRFVESDIRELPDLGRFDVAVAMTDPLSHLLADEELTAAFRGVAKSLAPGGVLVFDQRTERAYQRVSGQTIVSGQGRRPATWHVSEHAGDAEGPVFGMRVTRAVHTRQLEHQHFLRYRGEALIRDLLLAAGLECRGVHGLHDGGYLYEQPEPAHTTVLYVARKAFEAEQPTAHTSGAW